MLLFVLSIISRSPIYLLKALSRATSSNTRSIALDAFSSTPSGSLQFQLHRIRSSESTKKSFKTAGRPPRPSSSTPSRFFRTARRHTPRILPNPHLPSLPSNPHQMNPHHPSSLRAATRCNGEIFALRIYICVTSTTHPLIHPPCPILRMCTHNPLSVMRHTAAIFY